MPINTQKTRDGEIVSITVLRTLLSTGWDLSDKMQVIDGESFWLVEHDSTMDYCLASIRECDANDIHPRG
jgi:hypothetical protein